MLRIAEEAAAHTLIAENVPHLLRMDNGKAFELAIRSLEDADYPFVSWRTLNAREFGLPHASARLASNLPDFVDLEDTQPMSERAASGLLRRLHRSGKPCPADLLDCLIETAGDSLEDALKDRAGYNEQDSGIESEEAAEEELPSASLELFA